jgi:hypothetical protein
MGSRTFASLARASRGNPFVIGWKPMPVYVIFSRFTVIKNPANASTANPGQQEDFVILTFDSFQSSMF